jgi:hypothetical protein
MREPDFTMIDTYGDLISIYVEGDKLYYSDRGSRLLNLIYGRDSEYIYMSGTTPYTANMMIGCSIKPWMNF